MEMNRNHPPVDEGLDDTKVRIAVARGEAQTSKHEDEPVADDTSGINDLTEDRNLEPAMALVEMSNGENDAREGAMILANLGYGAASATAIAQ